MNSYNITDPGSVSLSILVQKWEKPWSCHSNLSGKPASFLRATETRPLGGLRDSISDEQSVPIYGQWLYQLRNERRWRSGVVL
jgi:hypothetical protein